MSEPNSTEATEPEDFGTLTTEDDPDGTVDPGDLAGTADESDDT